jgi:hypothetical protein
MGAGAGSTEEGREEDEEEEGGEAHGRSGWTNDDQDLEVSGFNLSKEPDRLHVAGVHTDDAMQKPVSCQVACRYV